MQESKMKEIAHMLGLEIGENFRIEINETILDSTYYLADLGLFRFGDTCSNDKVLNGILIGKYKVVKSLLTEEEREYLSTVIKPFRNRIKYIYKNNNEDGDTEFLDVQLDGNDFMAFPNFKKGTMYKGMEINKSYHLEELGL